MRSVPIPDFQEQLEENRSGVFRFLLGLTRDAVEAEDLTQEAFLMAWRKRELYASQPQLAAYLRRTAFRVYLSHRRKEWRRHKLAPVVDVTETPAEPAREDVVRMDALAFFLERTREALGELPAPQRHAFILYRFEGLACDQIAAALGVPPKTIATRVRRATLHLARRLRKHRGLLS